MASNTVRGPETYAPLGTTEMETPPVISIEEIWGTSVPQCDPTQLNELTIDLQLLAADVSGSLVLEREDSNPQLSPYSEDGLEGIITQ
jgi:hypothetical protein